MFSIPALLLASADPSSKSQLVPMLSSAKMSLRGIAAKLRQSQTSVQTGEVVEALRAPAEALDSFVKQLAERAAQLREA